MVREFTLTNGLRVVCEPMPYLASVACGAFIGTGSEDEQAEENGLSHCLEHMVFKGTSSRTAREIAEATDRIGGQVNASTSKEQTCYYGKVLDEKLPELLDLIGDLTQRASLDEGELTKEKGVILEEIAMVEDSPEDIVHDLSIAAHLGEHPLSRTILGTTDVITNLTATHLSDYYRQHYRPGNAVLSLAGNIDMDSIEGLVERHFGAWGDGMRPDGYPDIPAQPTRILRREKETEQLHLCLTFPGICYGDDDVYPLTVFNILFGTSMSSRLFQRIREERGLVYSVYSYLSNYVRAGMLTIYAGTSPQHGEEVVQLIRNEIDLILNEEIPLAEFEQARDQLRASYRLGLESNSGRMQGNGHAKLALGTIRSPEEVLNRIDRIQPDEVLRVARASLGGPYSAALVGPGQKGRRGGKGVDFDVEAIMGPLGGRK